MARNSNEAPLQMSLFESNMSMTVELTEIDGMENGAILRWVELKRGATERTDEEIQTCIGDLYVIINALMDYANTLESVITEWGLTDFHAETYRIHAARCRKIAEKYSDAIGYDYKAAMLNCRRRKSSNREDTGMDGIEAFVKKNAAEKNEKKER